MRLSTTNEIINAAILALKSKTQPGTSRLPSLTECFRNTLVIPVARSAERSKAKDERRNSKGDG